MHSSCFCPMLRLLPPSLSMASRPPCSPSMVSGLWLGYDDHNSLCLFLGWHKRDASRQGRLC